MNRIEDLERTARISQVKADEAKTVVKSLQRLMVAAGVSTGWASPEPRGIDQDFANIVLSLTTDATFSKEAIDIAARDLIDFFLDDDDTDA